MPRIISMMRWRFFDNFYLMLWLLFLTAMLCCQSTDENNGDPFDDSSRQVLQYTADSYALKSTEECGNADYSQLKFIISAERHSNIWSQKLFRELVDYTPADSNYENKIILTEGRVYGPLSVLPDQSGEHHHIGEQHKLFTGLEDELPYGICTSWKEIERFKDAMLAYALPNRVESRKARDSFMVGRGFLDTVWKNPLLRHIWNRMPELIVMDYMEKRQYRLMSYHMKSLSKQSTAAHKNKSHMMASLGLLAKYIDLLFQEFREYHRDYPNYPDYLENPVEALAASSSNRFAIDYCVNFRNSIFMRHIEDAICRAEGGYKTVLIKVGKRHASGLKRRLAEDLAVAPRNILIMDITGELSVAKIDQFFKRF